MHAVLIFNPASGSRNHRPECDLASARLHSHGWKATIVEASESRGITGAARDAVKTAGMIVACGGDGTVGAVAAVTAGTAIPLGILPMGTLNHLARDLGIPLDINKAVQILLTGSIQNIDIGQVNGLRFINNSSLGLYPSVVRNREARERGGWTRLLAFAAAAALAFRRFRLLHLRLEVDGQVFHRRTPFLFVGNNPYEIEGLRVGRRRHLNEGKLSVYLSDRTGRMGLIRLILSALFHRLRRNRDFAVLPAQTVVVRTRRKNIHVALDGEVVRLHPPLHYSILPRLLKVITP